MNPNMIMELNLNVFQILKMDIFFGNVLNMLSEIDYRSGPIPTRVIDPFVGVSNLKTLWDVTTGVRDAYNEVTDLTKVGK